MQGMLRSLRQMTIHYQLCTILMNAVTKPRPSSVGGITKAAEEISSFTSISSKPALGKSFAQSVDCSILITPYKLTVNRTPMMYVDEVRPEIAMQEVYILEVHANRYGARHGRWCAFTIEDDLLIQVQRTQQRR